MSNLSPYTGEWTFSKARHLLSRTTFGPGKTQIAWSAENGLEATIERLFEPVGEHDPPIYHRYDQDPDVPVGETWVNTPPSVGGLGNARNSSHTAWWMGLILNSGMNIHERMTLFWHEHFAITDVRLGRFSYHYSSILRDYALGNFRNLIEEMTICPAMLEFLNGNENTSRAPNENYARELLELFTIGRGDLAGPGDYTNYTEQDVEELARALTGWVSTTRLDDGAEIRGRFFDQRHDNGTKVLSERFDNAVIEDLGEEEYKRIIDLILGKKEVARYLCRQMHIWFVGSDIDASTEENVIEPMAQILFDGNFEIEPAIRALLASNYFNEGDHVGCMITSPIDFVTKMINTFETTWDLPVIDQYSLWLLLRGYCDNQGMAIMQLPTVAGWKAYYQQPNYYKTWINSVSLNSREEVITALLNPNGRVGRQLGVDIPQFFASLENPYDVNEMISEISQILFPFPLAENQSDFLKNIILPGLPDYVWGEEYSNYINFPDDRNIQETVEDKMRALLETMIKMPEFYLL